MNSCKKCGWQWFQRKDTPPKLCPKCKTKDWKSPDFTETVATVSNCLHCGHSWKVRGKKSFACPKCKSPKWEYPKRQKKGEAL